MSRPPRAVTWLDESPVGDAHAQTTIIEHLKTCQVPVHALLRTLRGLTTRRLLVQEQRAAAQQRLHPHRDRVHDLLNQALALSPPGTDLEDATHAALTEAESVCLTADTQSPARYARLRAAEPDQSPIAEGASVAAIQQRYMPQVRRLVADVIQTAISRQRSAYAQRGELFVVRVGARTYHDHDDAAVHDLSAQFIRAFFPTWGRDTTPEHIRKARKVRPG